MTDAEGTRFFLDCDADGHWYVIPADKRAEWRAWLDRIDPEDETTWDTPDYAWSLGCSYTMVTFTDPQVSR